MEVVMQNLGIAFPEKSVAERKKIASKFYRNLIDTFMEMIKMISASDSFLQKRFSGNWDLINELYPSGRAVHVHMGHTFNWEWGNYIAGKKLLYKFLGVYMPVKNKALNRLFMKIRARSGTILLPATPTQDFITSFKPHRDTQYLIGLAADQSPGNASRAYWLTFFGKPTAFVTGPEKGARAGNLPVFFCYITKPKRGYYNLVFSLAEENPATLEEGQLTIRFARYLETIIARYPDMWLWSHRRWKKEWKDEYQELWVDKKVV
jgi:KDO2-lipid IV(A) lauroyltransferase